MWGWLIDRRLKFDLEACEYLVRGESSYGAGDVAECTRSSIVSCASDDCSFDLCERHAKRCPSCGEFFCDSSRSLSTCFTRHFEEGTCHEPILREPLGKLAQALRSPANRELERFVNRDSDGLENPLPVDVCRHFGLAVVCYKELLPEYNGDVLSAQKEGRAERRATLQRRRRAARKFGLSIAPTRLPKTHISPYRNSRRHLVTGAIITHLWTGRWHYRQQAQILEIMGLRMSEDFIRDGVSYIQASNPSIFQQIESFARAITYNRPCS